MRLRARTPSPAPRTHAFLTCTARIESFFLGLSQAPRSAKQESSRPPGTRRGALLSALASPWPCRPVDQVLNSAQLYFGQSARTRDVSGRGSRGATCRCRRMGASCWCYEGAWVEHQRYQRGGGAHYDRDGGARSTADRSPSMRTALTCVRTRRVVFEMRGTREGGGSTIAFCVLIRVRSAIGRGHRADIRRVAIAVEGSAEVTTRTASNRSDRSEAPNHVRRCPCVDAHAAAGGGDITTHRLRAASADLTTTTTKKLVELLAAVGLLAAAGLLARETGVVEITSRRSRLGRGDAKVG